MEHNTLIILLAVGYFILIACIATLFLLSNSIHALCKKLKLDTEYDSERFDNLINNNIDEIKKISTDNVMDSEFIKNLNYVLNNHAENILTLFDRIESMEKYVYDGETQIDFEFERSSNDDKPN